ncbi:serine/threonine-protein kinase SBK1-like [Eurytemora carolleeae]|uniref:serine/threonine-protein kinase SBK1-like n=1 Tax=Eurytemora carolleeae TaxID=1294199 RepID=UPI000C77DC2B|nr:serine/threonine-protein kinase SBK1-like [Eurytemora carolleeae]|eukprot:XP_023329581.1 serine/threonine-protein kinase SBK1-like [Eurytemora affinis]
MAEKLKISEKFSFRPKPKLENLTSGSPSMHPHPTHLRPNIKLKSVGHKSDSDSGYGDINAVAENKIKQIDIESEYDLIQLLSEGWISKLYLAENRLSREEVVLKAINSNMITPEEFYREYQFSSFFSSHSNIVKVFENVFQSDGFYVFSTEYAPLGDLSSNIGEAGLGELYSKRVAAQVAAALGYIHSKNLCHLNVKLENILVFQSDFSLVKMADFGAVKTVGDITLKKNNQLAYCPPELVGKHAKEYYQVDRVQDVFQFGIVLLYCLLGVLPWQKPDNTDSNFNQFSLWRRKKSSKIPRPFKGLTARCQKLFRKILDPDPERRVPISELQKYLEDRWIRKGSKPILEVRTGLGDHHSQLTLGSFQSVHSNAVEKNRVLYTLLQYGVETTVDRRQKTHRIMTWIKQGAERGDNLSPSCQNFPEEYIPEEVYDTQDEKEDDIEELDAVDLAADE